MATQAAVSHEFASASAICQELLAGLEKKSADIGFLLCDAQVDAGGLAAELQKSLNFPIVGGTTLAFPMVDPDEDMSARLVLLEKEGMKTFTAVSRTAEEGQYREIIQDVYNECVEGLGEKPKMLLCHVPLMAKHNGELFVSELFGCAGDVPVFGGTVGADTERDQALTIANGRGWPGSLVLTAFGGNVQPAFAVGAQITLMSEYAPTVTKSEGNVVYMVDDMTFCEYLAKAGFATQGQGATGFDALFQYGPLPVQLEGKLKQDDGVPEIRVITGTCVEDGSASFSCAMPVGTKIRMGMSERKDILESTQKVMNEVERAVQLRRQAGYQPQLMLCVSCVARHFAQVGGSNDEGGHLRERMPEGMEAAAYHAFSEVCPTFGETGEMHNRTHADSLVVCVL